MQKLVPEDAVLVPDLAERVFKGQIYDVYQWPQKLFDGSEVVFEMLKRPDTVLAICVVNDRLLVLNEEQPHSGQRLSFPGGRADAEDESVLSAIQREVHEETGHVFKNWRLINVMQPHTKIEWFIHIYLAWDVAKVEKAHLDPGEKITINFLAFDDVKRKSLMGLKYLNESQEIFERTGNIKDLLALPEFTGQEVDR